MYAKNMRQERNHWRQFMSTFSKDWESSRAKIYQNVKENAQLLMRGKQTSARWVQLELFCLCTGNAES